MDDGAPHPQHGIVDFQFGGRRDSEQGTCSHEVKGRNRLIDDFVAPSRPRRTFLAESAVLMTRRSKQAWPDET
jgi:hypothetical protein